MLHGEFVKNNAHKQVDDEEVTDDNEADEVQHHHNPVVALWLVADAHGIYALIRANDSELGRLGHAAGEFNKRGYGT